MGPGHIIRIWYNNCIGPVSLLFPVLRGLGADPPPTACRRDGVGMEVVTFFCTTGAGALGLRKVTAMSSSIRNIAILGNHLPRKCGIATFTTDLVEALSGTEIGQNCWAVAVNDRPEGYPYPSKVRFEIDQNRKEDYRLAAGFLNIEQVDVVCVQHEFGIFGGRNGTHLLQLLRTLRMPIVVTLHTVLRDPTSEQRSIIRELADLSACLVVMAQCARQFLVDSYGVAESKTKFIHHGIPDMPFVDPNFYKDRFGVEGRTVILTFGLLSENKGIEHMIRALPEITRRHPEVVYMIVGATHPHVQKAQGEAYRMSLIRTARELGVEDHVIFHNKFVDRQELREYLGCADLYVTPYLNEAQIASGALAYAMGAGKAVISTPYWYAREMLADGRGELVDFKSAEQLSQRINYLLEHETSRHAIRKRAYTFCREAVWPRIGAEYLTVFEEVKRVRARCPHRFSRNRPSAGKDHDLPPVRLDHLLRLTDDTGILRHATFSIPNLEYGYTVDDNARALMIGLTAQSLLPDSHILPRLQVKYLGFLGFALDRETNRFRGSLRYDRTWNEPVGSEATHGRGLWGLGVNCGLSGDPGGQALGTQLFHRALEPVEDFTDSGAQAFSLLGIHAYLRRFSGDTRVRRARKKLAEKLLARFNLNAGPAWPWLEPSLSYAGASVCQALLLSGQWMQNGNMIETSLRALNWLIAAQTEEGHFSPVGTSARFDAQKPKARFDQQPVEAQAMIEACFEAYNVTRDIRYFDTARICFDWFLGKNDLGAPLYDLETAGCRDGLQPDGANHNQGADATLAWLQALTAMHYRSEMVRDTEPLDFEHRITVANEQPAQQLMKETSSDRVRVV